MSVAQDETALVEEWLTTVGARFRLLTERITSVDDDSDEAVLCGSYRASRRRPDQVADIAIARADRGRDASRDRAREARRNGL